MLFRSFQVGEVERVGGAELEVDELVAGFEEIFDAGTGVDAEVVAALGADLLVGLELCLKDDLAAAGASDPESFGANRLLRVVDDLVVLAFKPRHASLPSRVP